MLKRAMTLIELLIAITLLAVIVVGASSFDVGSREMLKASERKTQILNEAALVLDYITKDGLHGIGDVYNPALRIVNAGGVNYLLIKTDSTTAGTRGVRDPDNVDLVVGYARIGNQIIRCADYVNNAGNFVILSERAVDPIASPAPNNLEGFDIPAAIGNVNTAHVIVRLRYHPVADPQNPGITGRYDAFNNPQVTAETDIEVPAQSLN
jgi:prepilin-type N-terminal cleavage/methylation domain-containing protein